MQDGSAMPCGRAAFHAGFSLIEVLVSLIIISVGMLGLAKIQALSYSSTGVASLQSAAAIQASSLAAAMRANRSYWSTAATTTSSLSFVATTSAASATSTPSALTTVYNCASGGGDAPCTPAKMAAYDLMKWVANLNSVMPAPKTTITCPTLATATTPVGCTVQIDWTEQAIGVNAQSAGNTLSAPRYTLYVVP